MGRRRERTTEEGVEVGREQAEAKGGTLSFGSNSTQEERETTKLCL